jgi:hypothetical protein
MSSATIAHRATPTTADWNAAVACGLIRLAAGGALLRWPSRLARLAGARDGDKLVPLMLRGFGARDLSLGVHSLAATRPGGDPKHALRVQAGVDAVDGLIVAGAMAAGRLPKGRGIACLAFAAGSAVSLLVAARMLDRG